MNPRWDISESERFKGGRRRIGAKIDEVIFLTVVAGHKEATDGFGETAETEGEVGTGDDGQPVFGNGFETEQRFDGEANEYFS